MASLAEAITKAPPELQPVLWEITEVLRADRVIEHLDRRMDRVEATLERLAAAQVHTEERLAELAAAQVRSEQRLDRVEATLEKLAAAQVRSEQRLDRVEATLEKLAAAQARSEQRLDRVEATLEKLAAAQARSEKAIKELARQVGGLSDTVGFGFEEMGRLRVHDYLERRGIRIDTLDRRIVVTEKGELEFDLYGEGTANGDAVLLVGEIKGRISESEARRFLDKVDRAGPALPMGRRAIPVLFGFVIHPRAGVLVRERGGFAIQSYER